MTDDEDDDELFVLERHLRQAYGLPSPDPRAALDRLQDGDQVFRPATGQYGRVGATSEDGSVKVVWEPERPSWHDPSDLRKVES